MTYKFNSVPTYRTYRLSRAADAVQTKKIRTNTYNIVDVFQLEHFCSSRVSYVRRNAYKIYPDVLDLSVCNQVVRSRVKKSEML